MNIRAFSFSLKWKVLAQLGPFSHMTMSWSSLDVSSLVHPSAQLGVSHILRDLVWGVPNTPWGVLGVSHILLGVSHILRLSSSALFIMLALLFFLNNMKVYISSTYVSTKSGKIKTTESSTWPIWPQILLWSIYHYQFGKSKVPRKQYH